MARKIDHPLYARWRITKYHTENPSSPRYQKYRELGVGLTAKWSRDFWAYARWIEENLGPPPTPEHQLDRINNLKNWQPGNLRWSTASENHRNRIITPKYLYKGKRKAMADWCDELGLCKATVWSRINDLGWTVKEAFERRV